MASASSPSGEEVQEYVCPAIALLEVLAGQHGSCQQAEACVPNCKLVYKVPQAFRLVCR